MAFNHGIYSLVLVMARENCYEYTLRSINLKLYALLLKLKFTAMKILKVKVEYWLPGITIGVSGARKPVNINKPGSQLTRQEPGGQ